MNNTIEQKKMDENERLELINSLPTFNDAVAVVMWLEQ